MVGDKDDDDNAGKKNKKTIQIPITVGRDTNSNNSHTTTLTHQKAHDEKADSQTSISSVPDYSSDVLASFRNGTDDAQSSEKPFRKWMRKPLSSSNVRPPLESNVDGPTRTNPTSPASDGSEHTTTSNITTKTQEQPSSRGLLHFWPFPWITTSKDQESKMDEMIQTALKEAKEVATIMSMVVSQLPPFFRDTREMFPREARENSQSACHENGCDRDRSSWFDRSDDWPPLVSSYHQERDYARSARYHQDSRKDRLPIYRSQWINDHDDKNKNSNKTSKQDKNGDTTSAWVDQLLGSCNAMSQGKSEPDRLNRFAQAYDRVKVNDPNTNHHHHVNNKLLYHDNVAMLQAFQFCLAMENLGKQLPGATNSGK
jgi:hypothetical protein